MLNMTNTIELVFPPIDATRIADPAYQQEIVAWFDDAKHKALEAYAAATDDKAPLMAKAFTQYDLLRLFMAGTDAEVRQVLIDVSQAEISRAITALQEAMKQLSQKVTALTASKTADTQTDE